MTVFPRLDADADAIVVEAIAEAHRFRHGFLGTEHLLIAFASQPAVLPPAAAERLPPSDTLRGELARLIGNPAGAGSDAALLATLGIDLAEVRRRRGHVRARGAGSSCGAGPSATPAQTALLPDAHR